MISSIRRLIAWTRRLRRRVFGNTGSTAASAVEHITGCLYPAAQVQKGVCLMATYDSSTLPGSQVAPGDTVKFLLPSGEDVSYTVKRTGLVRTKGGRNDWVFHKHGLDKMAVARTAYGYEPRDLAARRGDHKGWPDARLNDFAALTRLVRHLLTVLGASGTSAPVAPPAPAKGTRENPFTKADLVDGLLPLLAVGNHVTIGGTVYRVCRAYLQRADDRTLGNSFPFPEGRATEQVKRALAQAAYGYLANTGSWPAARFDDFAALTRLASLMVKLH